MPGAAVGPRAGVTTGMTRQGVFNASDLGKVMTGEATRVSSGECRGWAGFFSPRGAYTSCEGQMNTPYQGAGNATFSSGGSHRMPIDSARWKRP